MTDIKNPKLLAHFEELKKSIPEVYTKNEGVGQNEELSEQLYIQLRHALGVIEAVYLQNPDGFTAARVEAYAQIVQKLNDLGFTYPPNQEIMDKAAARLIMRSKMPMERAGKKPADTQDEDRQAM